MLRRNIIGKSSIKHGFHRCLKEAVLRGRLFLSMASGQCLPLDQCHILQRSRSETRAIARSRIGERSKIGRASCRERVCEHVKILGVAVSLKKKITKVKAEQ